MSVVGGMRRLLSLFLLFTACGPRLTTFVRTDEAALGRVVVYRNGIAYYERQARVVGDTLSLRVPADKVDDFLKSLSVADARTGKALPVAFPTQLPATDGHVDMTVQLPPSGLVAPGAQPVARDVVLSYVTEAPAWKPSYRVTVGTSGQVELAGWAIVDNTSGEDWRAVKVGVGSSSAMSFRYDLHSIRLVHRETLHTEDTFAKAPPIGGSLFKEAERQLVVGTFADQDIPRQAGHPDIVADALAMAAPADGKSSGRGPGAGLASRGEGYGRRGKKAREQRPAADAAKEPAAPRIAHPMRKPITNDNQQVRALAESLKNRRGKIVIEGYADAGEADAEVHALDRANNLRNQLILGGVAPGQVEAIGRGVQAGQRAGVRVVEKAEPRVAGTKVAEDAPPVGESHFESGAPMTVKRGTSAMVSIVQGAAQGEIVYLYDAETRGGDGRYAFRAVRFRNPTDSTLETGPMTVYGNARFIGEGLTEAIPPKGIALVPFALDRQVVVEKKGADQDHISRLVKLVRGVLTAEVQHVRKIEYKLQNRSHAVATVLVRHTVGKGWTLEKAPKASLQLGDARVFELTMQPGETRTLALEEQTPMTRTLDLRSPVGIDLVRLWLETPAADAKVAAEMKRLVHLHGDIAVHEQAIDHLRQRGEEFRLRLDELHGQIMSLQMVKAGNTLLGHLQTKMKEISERVQSNTLAIVDRQEKLMVAKVRFADGVAELTLDKAGTAKTTVASTM